MFRNAFFKNWEINSIKVCLVVENCFIVRANIFQFLCQFLFRVSYSIFLCVCSSVTILGSLSKSRVSCMSSQTDWHHDMW